MNNGVYLSLTQSISLFHEFDEERTRGNLSETSKLLALAGVVAIAEIDNGDVHLSLLHEDVFRAWMSISSDMLRKKRFSSLFDAVNECRPQ